jgi:LysM repeat protein/predicted chitinase
MSTYSIQPGDTLSGIASNYGVSLDALEQANPAISNPDQIEVGQTLNIPDGMDAPVPAAPSSPAVVPTGGSYMVQPGDTLSGIAALFGTTVDALAQANGIGDPNNISVGQQLTIPGAGGPAPAPAPAPSSGGSSYTVQPGDNLSAIAARFGTTVDAIAQANGISDPNRIDVGQVLTIPGAGGPAPAPAPAPSSGGSSYTVQPGDTLSAIAAQFGTTVDAIAQANGISDPNRIDVGQVLTIPGGSGPGPVQGPPPSSGPAPQGFHPLTPDEFRAIAPNLGGKAEQYTPYLNDAMVRFGITTPEREAAFLAQITEETAGFDTLTEYGSGWEYEGRGDLGNTQPGDGPRYKGRGAIQLTGRANYENYGAKLGLDLVNNPDQAADPSVAFLIAGQYWSDHGLNQLADQGDFIDITRRINGGTNGEASREYYWSIARRELGI